MCGSTIIGAIGAVVSAVSTVAQGYAAKQQADYQAGVDRFNAREKENEAVRLRNIGVEKENEQRQRTAQLLSQQRAQLGAANVDLMSGSPLQLQEDTLSLGEVDALRIRSNYADAATTSERQADLLYSQASATKKAGQSAFMGSLLSAGGEFLASGVADKWFTPSSAGVQAMGPSSTGVQAMGPSASMGNNMMTQSSNFKPYAVNL